MTQIEFVKDVPLPEGPMKPFAEHTLAMSSLVFAYGDKLYGGIARQSLFDPPELWVWLTSTFRPRDLIILRRTYLSELLTRYPYIRARIEVGNEAAERFAAKFGFVYEETVEPYKFYSMRAG